MKQRPDMIVIALLLILLASSVLLAKPDEQVEICRIPPDNPQNTRTIAVDANQIDTYLAQGDRIGSCDAYRSTLPHQAIARDTHYGAAGVRR